MPELLPSTEPTARKIVPADEDFTCDPDLIFDQADFVARHNFGESVLPVDNRQFLIFSRRVKVRAPGGFAADSRGMMWGEQIVAYHCDDHGDIESWERRYEAEAHTYESALRKFRYMLANGLAWLERCSVPTQFADVR